MDCSRRHKGRVEGRMHRCREKVHLHLVFCQVIIHHHHNLLIWDPILVNNLVRVTGISLKDRKDHEELSEMPFNRLEGRFCDNCPHLVPVVVPAIGAGYDHHPVFPTVWLLGGKRLDHHPETQPEQEQQGWFTHPGLVSFTVVDDTDKH